MPPGVGAESAPGVGAVMGVSAFDRQSLGVHGVGADRATPGVGAEVGTQGVGTCDAYPPESPGSLQGVGALALSDRREEDPHPLLPL